MDIDVSRIADIVLMRLSGEFFSRRDLAPVLLSYLRRGHTKFILCFTSVRAINSVGLQTLIEMNSILESKGGGIRLCNLNPQIARTMTASRIDEVVRVAKDEDTAFVDLLTSLPIGSGMSSVSKFRN